MQGTFFWWNVGVGLGVVACVAGGCSATEVNVGRLLPGGAGGAATLAPAQRSQNAEEGSAGAAVGEPSTPNPTCTGGGMGTWEQNPVPASQTTPRITQLVSYQNQLLAVSWRNDERYVGLYNPVSNTWKSYEISPNAPTARDVPFLGVVGDKLYVYGGITNLSSQPFTPETFLTTGATLDLLSGEWAILPTSGAPALNPGPAGQERIFSSSGKVVVLGIGGNYPSRPETGVFDPATGTWVSRLTAPNFSGCSDFVAVDSKLGLGACASWEHVELVDAARSTGLTSAGIPLGEPAVRAYPAWAQERLFVFFQSTFPSSAFSAAKFFDRATQTWQDIASPPIASRSVPLVAAFESRVVVWSPYEAPTGGVYNPANGAWEPISNCPLQPTGFVSFALINNRLYIANTSGAAISSLSL